MIKRISAVLCILCILALLSAVSALADATWECEKCGRRIQAGLGDVCPFCGAHRHVHSWQEATCTEPKTCPKCGETEGEALGHCWDQGTVIQEATCRETGLKLYLCERCGTARKETIPKDFSRHAGETEIRSRAEATCVTDGYTGDTYCTGCGKLILAGNRIAAAGHRWDEGIEVRAATCQATGMKRFICTVCGETREEPIPKDPSNHAGGTEIRFRSEATCTANGYTGDVYCIGCGERIGTGSPIAALGHLWQDATYSSPKVCSRCGLTEGTALAWNVFPGGVVSFGRYPQTESGSDSSPIEWTVLDVQGNKALLLSKYGLDAKPYNDEQSDVSWENCSLRSWLNGAFLNAAFTADEQKRILLTDTGDRVYLLSHNEAVQYLGIPADGSANSNARVSPTAYAEASGAFASYSDRTAEGEAAGWWWLRSTEAGQPVASEITSDGSLSQNLVRDGFECVRPALWVDVRF